MGTYNNSEDNTRKIILPPYLRAWFSRRRSWHQETVRVHAECRNIADGAAATVAVYGAVDGQKLGAAIRTADGKISKGRLVGADGQNGVEHKLDWRLTPSLAGATGLVATVKVPDYAAAADSTPLELDLRPYSISG